MSLYSSYATTTPWQTFLYNITIVCHTRGKVANSTKMFTGVSLRNRMVPYTPEASFQYLKGGLGLSNKALWYLSVRSLSLLYEAR